MLSSSSPLATVTTEKPTKEFRHQCLVRFLKEIKDLGYRFTTVTPRTHQIFLSRNHSHRYDLRDIFGWNISFDTHLINKDILRLMSNADMIELISSQMRSKLRVASLGNDIFLHSAFPTTQEDAVFFGPDTYRFSRFLKYSSEKYLSPLWKQNLRSPTPLKILDIGCGTGAGGITLARVLPKSQAYELTMNDINVAALELTAVNAEVAGITAQLLPGDIFENISGTFDVIISNPPYISDPAGRAYRDGGSQLGLGLSIRIVKTALEHLAPGGKLFLYTGVAMTDESDPFCTAITQLLLTVSCSWSYEEIDPDIFGEELEQPAYENAHRIAAVGLTLIKHDNVFTNPKLVR